MDVLVTSRKPLIVAGGGVIMANAAEELCTLAHLMHAPVCSTLMGLGAFPGDDPLWIGMPRYAWDLRGKPRRDSG